MRAALLLSAALALAAAEEYTVDPAASTVVFHCATTWHDFDGSATIASGRLRLDGERSSGAVSVRVSSMTTAKEARDAKMRDEVLAGAAHPEIRFELEWFERTAAGTVAHGRWTMHGATRAVSLPVTVAGGRATASFPLEITGWGIEPPSIVVNRMSPTVTVDLDLALVPAGGR